MSNPAPLAAGVIGWPVGHSRSPLIHHAAARHLGVDLTYSRFPVAVGEVAAAFDAIRTLHLRGVSVTTPHKEEACRLVDDRSAVADRLGAVNCVINDNGRLTGLNTDGEGFLIGLNHALGLGVGDARVVILGAGGAARAIGVACADAGAAHVGFMNRSEQRALQAVKMVGKLGHLARDTDLAVADIVVNASVVGMAGSGTENDVPVELARVSRAAVVVDIVYTPLVTRLLAEAASAGLRTVGGLPMLAGQAAAQFSAWTGIEAPLDVMLEAVA